jgi:hypothetical protein
MVFYCVMKLSKTSTVLYIKNMPLTRGIFGLFYVILNIIRDRRRLIRPPAV